MSRKQTDPTADRAGTPSDLELMLYADGELEEARLAEVEAYLERTTSARSKVRSLDRVSDLVREQAIAAASEADSLADAIMAQIQRESANQAKSAAPKLATVHPFPTRARALDTKGKAANDNSRGIFTLAAVAFATAAGLMIWGKMSVTPDPHAHLKPIPVETAVAPAKTAEVVEAEDEHGVEVASVNFGSRTGSIFYVPKGAAASNATTTVVWLNDDAAGGE